MSTRPFARGSILAVLLLGLLTMLPSPGFSHSGGTDKYGCHAGSQPYHCHGGGSGGGGGGGGGAPKADPGPTAAERAATAAKQAKIANTQAKLSQARASFAQTKPRAEKLEKRSLVAEEKLNEQRSEVESLRSEVDSQRLEAENLRAEHIEERDEAAERIELVEVSNETALEDYENSRLAGVYLGGLFAGFLLFSIANLLAAAVTVLAWRIVLATTGLFGSLALLGMSMSMGSFGMGFVPALLGGLLISFVFMLARAWLFAAKTSVVVAVTFAGLAALLAIAGFASAATVAPPPAEQPAQTDQALVEEAEEDPAAEELEQAQVVEATADELQPEVEELETDLADIESKVEALAEKTEDAQAEAEKDKKAIELAKDKLSSLG